MEMTTNNSISVKPEALFVRLRRMVLSLSGWMVVTMLGANGCSFVSSGNVERLQAVDAGIDRHAQRRFLGRAVFGRQEAAGSSTFTRASLTPLDRGDVFAGRRAIIRAV